MPVPASCLGVDVGQQVITETVNCNVEDNATVTQPDCAGAVLPGESWLVQTHHEGGTW